MSGFSYAQPAYSPAQLPPQQTAYAQLTSQQPLGNIIVTPSIGSSVTQNVLPVKGITVSVPVSNLSEVKFTGFGAPRKNIKYLKIMWNDQKVDSLITKLEIISGLVSSDYGYSMKVKYLDSKIIDQLEVLINRIAVMENIPAFQVPIDATTLEGWVKVGPNFQFPPNAIFDAKVSFGVYMNTESKKTGLFLRLN